MDKGMWALHTFLVLAFTCQFCDTNLEKERVDSFATWEEWREETTQTSTHFFASLFGLFIIGCIYPLLAGRRIFYLKDKLRLIITYFGRRIGHTTVNCQLRNEVFLINNWDLRSGKFSDFWEMVCNLRNRRNCTDICDSSIPCRAYRKNQVTNDRDQFAEKSPCF